jgi:hypothetical protein
VPPLVESRVKRLPAERQQVYAKMMDTAISSFSEATMLAVAHAARTRARQVSIDGQATSDSRGASGSLAGLLPQTETENPIDAQDEYEHTLQRIQLAIEKADFDRQEQAIVLERLDLAHDGGLYARIENELSAGSLRNRKLRLLVRFMAALHCGEAPRFGRFLDAQPEALRPIMQRALDELAADRGIPTHVLILRLLNLMSLTDNIYKLSIAERGRLEQFLLPKDRDESTAKQLKIDGHVYNKLKAALMQQESLGFPFLSR